MHQILESIAIALRSIWANKLRSFMTVLGNIVAVTSIVTIVSLIQGMNAMVSQAIVTDVGADSFTVQRRPPLRTAEDEDAFGFHPRVAGRRFGGGNARLGRGCPEQPEAARPRGRRLMHQHAP